MIGLFDSGHGGLTVYRALVQRFPKYRFVFLGDHANAPYGDRTSDEVLVLTQAGTEKLFSIGCRLVILACNTATAVACRHMQQSWLPQSNWQGNNVLGIVAPTVEVATQTPWAVTTPQYPQKYNSDTIAVFGTSRTIASNVYPEEILKRCPQARIIQQACPRLVQAIEDGAPSQVLSNMVTGYVKDLKDQIEGREPDRVILGCTHYPLIEDLFRDALSPVTRLLAQPSAVADSLDDYLERHPDYSTPSDGDATAELFTTGDPQRIARTLSDRWPDVPDFRAFVAPAPEDALVKGTVAGSAEASG